MPRTRKLARLWNGRDDGVAQSVADLRRELADVRAQLRANGEQLRRLGDLVATNERVRRHDIRVAASVRALAESEAFVAEHLRMVPFFDTSTATMKNALEQVRVDGLALEFGVASGRTLRQIAAALPAHDVYGFDVFTGLPEDWRAGFRKGMFAQGELPDVPGATLVPGLFADTVPAFAAEHPGPVAFLHLDADLYSSTVTVLDLLGDRLVPGSVVVLDEYFNYPGWQDGEHRAWQEYVARTGTRFEFTGFTRAGQQVSLRIVAAD